MDARFFMKKAVFTKFKESRRAINNLNSEFLAGSNILLGGIFLRLDKFLKVSRIIKRRTLAKEVCDGGKITVNGRVAKAGLEVKPGDRVDLQIGSRNLSFEIMEIKDTVPAKEAASLYKVITGN